MPITLYMTPESPPSRAVMMTCEAIGLDLEYKTVALEKADHLQPSFLKVLARLLQQDQDQDSLCKTKTRFAPAKPRPRLPESRLGLALGNTTQIAIPKCIYLQLTNMNQNFTTTNLINPQHTVPTLVDENTVIWDSHAIMTYLVSKYAKDDALYPKNLEQRALVDQRLHFDTGSLFVHLRLYIKKCFSGNRKKDVEDHERTTVLDSYNLLEEFLHKSAYMAGDGLTIADFSIITSVTGLNIMVSIDAKLYPRLCSWIEKMESLPYYNKVNEVGLQDLEDFMRNISQEGK